MISNRLRKAVFPVAGFGTRFLPATKASPKEMLPIVDKPLIQFAVEEAAAAGIDTMIFITGRNKRAIEDHFDKAYELETELALREKHQLLDELQSVVPPGIHCVYIRQVEAKGLGHAVLSAESVVGDEAFAVVLADDLIDHPTPALVQMAEHFALHGESLISTMDVDRADTASWGICDVQGNPTQVARLQSIVEKPAPDQAPSTLAVVGRYIFTPQIFDCLRRIPIGSGGEMQLTDGISQLLQQAPVHSFRFEGTRYDCGRKLGYLQATVAYGLRHREGGDAFRRYLEVVLEAGQGGR